MLAALMQIATLGQSVQEFERMDKTRTRHGPTRAGGAGGAWRPARRLRDRRTVAAPRSTRSRHCPAHPGTALSRRDTGADGQHDHP